MNKYIDYHQLNTIELDLHYTQIKLQIGYNMSNT